MGPDDGVERRVKRKFSECHDVPSEGIYFILPSFFFYSVVEAT